MLQSKKLNGRMLAVVVLSVLLMITVTVGATMAWFANSDSASGQLGLTGHVQVDLDTSAYATDENGNPILNNDKEKILAINDLTLVPSHPIEFNINATVQDTNTPYLVRARFNLTQASTGTAPDGAEGVFRDFLAFDKGTVGETGVNDVSHTTYTWSTEADDEGWYYLMNNSSFVVGSFHEEDDKHTIPSHIGSLDLKIANGLRIVPTSWGNEYAGLTYRVDLVIQATQAEVYTVTYDENDDEYSYGGQIEPDNLSNVQSIFTQVFNTYPNN